MTDKYMNLKDSREELNPCATFFSYLCADSNELSTGKVLSPKFIGQRINDIKKSGSTPTPRDITFQEYVDNVKSENFNDYRRVPQVVTESSERQRPFMRRRVTSTPLRSKLRTASRYKGSDKNLTQAQIEEILAEDDEEDEDETSTLPSIIPPESHRSGDSMGITSREKTIPKKTPAKRRLRFDIWK